MWHREVRCVHTIPRDQSDAELLQSGSVHQLAMQNDLGQGADRCCKSESCRNIATCAALPSGQPPDAELVKRFVASGPRSTSTIAATCAARPSRQPPDAELAKRFVASGPRSTSTIAATCAARPSRQPPDAELAKRFVASGPRSTSTISGTCAARRSSRSPFRRLYLKFMGVLREFVGSCYAVERGDDSFDFVFY
ncbi:uncharacterized protein LOC144115269 [Amblyomma americanum]